MGLPPLMIAFIGMTLAFGFLNGFLDSCNCVGTLVASRSMSPRAALLMAAIADFFGPLLFGVAVATTIGKGLISPEAVTIPVVLAAVAGAILWSLITWYFAIPSSSSHALVGGLIGAAGTAYGLAILHADGLIKILFSLLMSPILGFAAGYIFLKGLRFLIQGASPKIGLAFKRLQIPASAILALSHGANDAQKAMGIITMGLVTSGYQDHFIVPRWVILACAGAMALGTLSGGLRLIKTIGTKMYRVRPIDAFSTQVCATAVILGAALLGGPVSTTQVVNSALLGVGTAERISKIRWGVAMDIAITWLITIPLSAGIAAILYLLLRGVIPY